jgi:selT/selW/selH-like putative selenoprotein
MGFSITRMQVTIVVVIFFGCLVVTNNCDKEIPITRFSQNVGGPTMTFLYCYSCGYRKAFDEYVSILHEKYPDISIKGSNYDPPGINTIVSRAILISKFLLIMYIISSVDLFAYFGRQAPSWWTWCTENKLYACMMVFFIGNMLESQLISSGAFEISLNDVPVWSKLQTGRIPSPQELFQIIDSHLQFNENTVNVNPDFVK